MQLDILPRSFWNFPSKVSNLWEDDEDWRSFLPSAGLTIAEDENKIYVEAAVPGVDPKNIEVTFDKGILWIKGQAKEQEDDKKLKFYRKASRSFTYRVAVPGILDEKIEPELSINNGLLKAAFKKLPETEPKKLKIKTE